MLQKIQTEVSDYPRMTKLKSKINIIRQKTMQKGTQWLQKRSTESSQNPYLEGIYAPTEEVEVQQFNVIGEIPTQLSGILLRIGPNPIHVDQPSLHHWFSGDGMIHGLRIEQGQAQWFKSRYIATDTVQNYKNKKLVEGYRRGPGDLVNTNAFYYAGKIWAVIEAGTFPACLDLNLNTERHQFFNTDADLPFTAHPHQDSKTGHLHAICYDAMDHQHAYYEVLNEHGKLVHFTKIPVQHGPMIHDCAITERDVLIFDFPVTFSVKQILRGNNLPYEWNTAHRARIGVLPLYGQASQIQWFEVGGDSFVFHAANAYRNEHDMIVLDVLVHDRMFDQSKQGPFEHQKTQLERWLISTHSEQIQRTVIDAQTQEFPRIDERLTGKKYQYIYAVSYDSKIMSKANQLLIHDLYHQKKNIYDYGENWVSGEVIFIPETKQSDEGQGYLLSYVHHLDGSASKVVILKVTGLEVQLQAEIDLGVRVPLGFHCNWVGLDE